VQSFLFIPHLTLVFEIVLQGKKRIMAGSATSQPSSIFLFCQENERRRGKGKDTLCTLSFVKKKGREGRIRETYYLYSGKSIGGRQDWGGRGGKKKKKMGLLSFIFINGRAARKG